MTMKAEVVNLSIIYLLDISCLLICPWMYRSNKERLQHHGQRRFLSYNVKFSVWPQRCRTQMFSILFCIYNRLECVLKIELSERHSGVFASAGVSACMCMCSLGENRKFNKTLCSAKLASKPLRKSFCSQFSQLSQVNQSHRNLHFHRLKTKISKRLLYLSCMVNSNYPH